jgi:hypothetical protein
LPYQAVGNVLSVALDSNMIHDGITLVPLLGRQGPVQERRAHLWLGHAHCGLPRYTMTSWPYQAVGNVLSVALDSNMIHDGITLVPLLGRQGPAQERCAHLWPGQAHCGLPRCTMTSLPYQAVGNVLSVGLDSGMIHGGFTLVPLLGRRGPAQERRAHLWLGHAHGGLPRYTMTSLPY